MSFRTYNEIEGEDRSQLMAQVVRQRERVGRRLESVDRVVAVLSGKGGVGKSFVAAALARGVASRPGKEVGVLDADLRSPTVAGLLGATGSLRVTDDGVEPAVTESGVRVVSTSLLLDDDQPLRWKEPAEARFVWRGTLESGALREFLSDVVWGSLGLLLVDLPPGADGGVDLLELVPNLTGALVITIPSEESRQSVARTMQSASEAGVKLLGIVENMSGHRCDDCGVVTPLFDGSAGSELSAAFGVPLLASIPFSSGSGDPAIWAGLVEGFLGVLP